MDTILNIIKKIIPQKMLDYTRPIYHKIMARVAAFWYGYPSEKMIVIGVTGTNGKSTTTELIARVLEQGQPLPSPLLKGEGVKSWTHCKGGELEKPRVKVGFTSTVKFKVGDKEWLNDKKMTMVGRFQLQKLLRDMVKAGCKYAVIETSSEGIKQFRHRGVNYDYLVFTNLTPEHIESHGSFERYKLAKLELFKHFEECRHKKLRNKEIKKLEIVNGDDTYASDFLNFNVDKKIVYGIDSPIQGLTPPLPHSMGELSYRAENVRLDKTGTYFNVVRADSPSFEEGGSPPRLAVGETGGRFSEARLAEASAKRTGMENLAVVEFKLNLLGKFNVYNALPAIIIGQNEGLDMQEIKDALASVKNIPGRMEFIDAGQNFKVLIDYAPEPESMRKLYETVKLIIRAPIPANSHSGNGRTDKIIHVLGSCGGGRDKARRSVLGKIAAENADIVIVTNEDPYDDDPMEIIEDVARGAISIKQENNKTRKQSGSDCGMGMRDSTARGKIPPNPPLEKGGIQKVFKILDRREAIRKALELAKSGDLVLITGKGAEQAMCVANGKKIAWDDRQVVREEIGKIMNYEL